MPQKDKRYSTLLSSDSKDESDRMTHCRLCFQDVHTKETLPHYLLRQSVLCGECRSQIQFLGMLTRLDELPLYIMYLYNDFLENMIYQFKEGRDIALKEVFFHEIIQKLNDRFRHYTIVLMPSSREKMIERHFLPVREMLCECKLPIVEPFYKTCNHKQSLQSFENRASISRVIKKKEDVLLPSTPLLLVDDVCTSGSTLLCAYRMLSSHRYKIEALVLSAHPKLVESCDEIRLRKRSQFSIL